MISDLTPLSLTRKLLRFNTMNPPGHERECAQYLGSLLEGAGFKVTFYDFAEARTNLIARLEGTGQKSPICFTGHTDTIPLGATPWKWDPFTGETQGDKLYGRGASDMKGGLAAMVIAALRLAEGPSPQSGITLVITAGEETGCQGAYHLARLDRVLAAAGALVVGEPTSNFPLVGHKGALWLEARTTGIAAHGSMPDQGVNAIYKAARAVMTLSNYDFGISPHPTLGPPTLNVGTISGGININSVPDEALIGIDIRTIPGQTNKAVHEKLASRLGAEWELKSLVDVDGVATDPAGSWVQDVFRIMKPYLKMQPVARGGTYFTDASVLTPALGQPPTLILGPGEPTMAHRTDEWCAVSKIEEASEAYLEIAKQWCGL